MAELAWPADLGHGTFTGRFGFMDADSHDPDRDPDITSATGGKATITPSIKSVRYTGTDGPMILAARPADGVIDSEGYLCTTAEDGTAGDVGMVFPATDDTDLAPTDWTYQVTVTLDGGVRLPSFNVKLPTGATVDLSLAVPVDTSGGTAVVVDPTTATRAEAAATRAETAADEAEGYTPTFVWDGTKLVIDGGTPVDLKGEKGDGSAWADLTGKPATYPPAAHTHPITDVDGLEAALSALADANRTTDWRSLPLSNGWTGSVLIKRSGVLVEILIDGIQRGETAVAFTIPSGFRPYAWGSASPRPPLTDTSNPPNLDRTHISVGGAFSVLSTTIGAGNTYGSFTYTTTDLWPATLPPLA